MPNAGSVRGDVRARRRQRRALAPPPTAHRRPPCRHRGQRCNHRAHERITKVAWQRRHARRTTSLRAANRSHSIAPHIDHCVLADSRAPAADCLLRTIATAKFSVFFKKKKGDRTKHTGRRSDSSGETKPQAVARRNAGANAASSAIIQLNLFERVTATLPAASWTARRTLP